MSQPGDEEKQWSGAAPIEVLEQYAVHRANWSWGTKAAGEFGGSFEPFADAHDARPTVGPTTKAPSRHRFRASMAFPLACGSATGFGYWRVPPGVHRRVLESIESLARLGVGSNAGRLIVRMLTIVLLAVGLGAANLRGQTPPVLSAAVKQYVTVDAPIVALTHVRLIDGTGGPVRDDQTVVLANGRIQSVGPAASATVPPGAKVLDLTGHTVIPGLVGLHDHMLYTTRNRMVQISTSASKLYLATGITTIRTTGALQPYDEITQKAQIERGAAPGPRMHITGPHISGGPPLHFGADMTVNSIRYVATPEEARRTVAYWADEGADWIKVYTGITRAQLAAVIDEAHKRGLGVTGHLCSVTFAEATELGIDNVEHGLPTNTEFHPSKQPDLCPTDGTAGQLELDFASERVQATFRNMVKKGVAMTSTLCVFEPSVPNRPPLEDRVLEAMAPDVKNEVLAARADIAKLPVGPATAHFKKAMAYELAFVRAGGLLAAGSDPTGYGAVLPGFGDQRNYELLLEAGFTPVEAIQIMSSNGAKVLRLSDRLGTVTAGKLADVVVIRGNPVANPADIRNVTTVFKDGVGYDSAKLIASVHGLVGIR